MGNKIIVLSGAATDVLYALFFRGALQSGDLPSKAGAAELREQGLAETRHTATEYQKENYFTFLTSEGQAFAIGNLVNTRFGKEPKQQYCCSVKIGIEPGTSSAQKPILDAQSCSRDLRLMTTYSAPKFKIADGEVFINNAFLSDAIAVTKSELSAAKSNTINADEVLAIAWQCGCRSAAEGVAALALAASAYQQGYKQHAAGGETTASTYTVSIGINGNDKAHSSGIGSNIDSILQNALGNVAEAVAMQVKANEKAMAELSETVRKAIQKECQPGGLLWNRCGR